MSGSINKVTLVGHLGSDPESRMTQAGNPVVTLSVATSERWRDKTSGERRERTEWHRIVIFNERLAEIAERYLHKGSHIYLEGQLRTRKWSDQNGQDRYSTEVVLQRYRGELTMLNSGLGSEHAPDDANDDAATIPSRAADNTPTLTQDDMLDEIPF